MIKESFAGVKKGCYETASPELPLEILSVEKHAPLFSQRHRWKMLQSQDMSRDQVENRQANHSNQTDKAEGREGQNPSSLFIGGH